MEINNIDKEYIENARDKALKNDHFVLDIMSWKRGWEAAMRFAKKVDKAYHICDHCHKLILPDKNGEANYVIGVDCILCSDCNNKLKNKEI